MGSDPRGDPNGATDLEHAQVEQGSVGERRVELPGIEARESVVGSAGTLRWIRRTCCCTAPTW
jgi:hypothetical protein